MRRPSMEWATVGFLTLVSLGARLSVVAGAPFPVNDGGLFYAFTSDLLANGMRLPDFSSYNGAGIPLVYPPLGFYITAALHLLTRIAVLDLLRFVPSIVSAAAIPAFFGLASLLLQGSRQALLATFIFSMIPRAFDWLIMGGGITRSFGLLFFLLFLTQSLRLVSRRDSHATLPAIVFGGLLILSHPEAAVHAAITAALLVAWHQRTRSELSRSLLIVLAVSAITSPWWLFVLTRHGLDPWLAGLAAAHQDTYNPLVGLLALFRFDFTDEPFLRLFGVLGLLGLAVLLTRRDYFLAAWIVLVHFVEPRGGSLFMMIPLAMSAGLFVDDILLPALEAGPARTVGQTAQGSSQPLVRRQWLPTTAASGILIGFLFLYGTVAAYVVGLRLQQDASLQARDVAALEWVASHTAPDDRFAIVTGGLPLLDATADWFPAITERRSVSSFFGTEWIPRFGFGRGLGSYEALQACLSSDSRCIEDWMHSSFERIDYVYVRAPDARGRTSLLESLSAESDFRLVYSEDGVEIYAWLEHATN